MGQLLLYLAVLLVGSGLLASGGQAQVPQNVITECEACNAQDAHAADLNGDDTPDVLSASLGDDKIAWHENNGDGTFSDQKVITTDAEEAQSVHAVDLTGSGDPDVLSASFGDDKIAWYENNGDGSFSEQKVITASADGARSVFAVDLTDDGTPDVLSASSGDDKIAWYENQGGSFSDQKIISTSASGARSVYAADLTGDGNPDVLSASDGDDKIAWYENNGDGTFSEEKVLTASASGPRSVVAADLNGDDAPDVLSGSELGGIAWHENNGDGSFSERQFIDNNEGAVSVEAADLTGSGDLDVIYASSEVRGGIAYIENEGGGNFSGFPRSITSDAPKNSRSVFATDLSGDGASDVLFASEGDDKIAWNENEGDGFFADQSVLTACSACKPRDVHAADLTGDGTRDVLSASFDDGKIAWYENQGGSFSAQRIITTSASGARSVYAADLNGDGATDVLSASAATSFSNADPKIAWYENGGNGSFSEQKIITTDVSDPSSVYAADLNGDGATDVLSADDGSGEIAWYENQGDSTFSDKRIIAVFDRDAQSVRAADLDGDGDLDVLSASLEIAWHENQGGGTFSDPKTIDSAGNPVQSVQAADLAGNGTPDVLSAFLSGFVGWYENQGEGAFSDDANVVTEGIVRGKDAFAADLNGDGSPDVLSASSGDNKIAWHENNGDGTFSDQKVITTDAKGAQSIYAADLTGNAALDVLSGSQEDDKIAWHENTENALPVEMAGFKAIADGETVRLSWTTASETGNAGFRVQRRVGETTSGGENASGGNGTWEQIGQVEGSGTTTEATSYRFTDANLPYEADWLEYRLKQVDTDGSASYTDPVAVERAVDEVELLGTYPNPARSQATVRYALPEKQEVTLRLYDMLGRQVRTVLNGTREGRYKQRVDTSGLPSGTYFLRLRSDGQTRTQKLTVVR